MNDLVPAPPNNPAPPSQCRAQLTHPSSSGDAPASSPSHTNEDEDEDEERFAYKEYAPRSDIRNQFLVSGGDGVPIFF